MGTQDEIIRAVLSYTHPAGSVAQNVFTWELQDEDTADGEILDGIDAWVDAEWADTWINIADSNVMLYLCEVDVLNANGTVKRNIGEEIYAHTGVNVGDVTGAAVSGFFQMDTARPKSFGRKYTPGVPEAAIDEGTIGAAFLAQLVALFLVTTTGIDIGIAGLLAPGILSRVTEGFLEFTGAGYSTDVPAYQRRRKPGVGS